jgi:glycosyltransferase involved in cell wall biosynthesis
MHLIVITTSFPEKATGEEAAGTFVADFVEELSHHLRVTVIAPGVSASVSKEKNLCVRRFSVPFLPLSLLKPYNPLHWPKIAETLRNGWQELDKLLKEGPADFVFALWALPSGYWAYQANRRYGIPYGIWALGSDIWVMGKVPVVRSILKSVIRNSQYCVADGYLLAEEVHKLSSRTCGFLPSFRKLPLAAERHPSSNPPYRLTFLGRWHSNKGVDILLDSLNRLSESDWGHISEIRIAGGGPMEALVDAKCDELQQKGRPVRRLGYLNKLEAGRLLLDTDYLLIPSRVESIPVVFSDAMQSRCPVISMPVGDLPRLVESLDVGVLAQEVSPLAFSQAIRLALASSPKKYEQGLSAAASSMNMETLARNFISQLQAMNQPTSGQRN